MKNFKHLYRQTLKHNPHHFAAHSHHPWPDVTFDAQKLAWLDAAKNLDRKWEDVFGKTLTQTRTQIANLLGGVSPEQICEGQNTFDILVRVMSSLNWTGMRAVNILTTDSEFYSFTRHVKSLKQYEMVDLTIVPAEPFNTFKERFTQKLKEKNYDMVFMSHVFFNSGFTTTSVFDELKKVKDETLVIIDGYHSLGAIPVNLKPYEKDFYYLGGGYKYLSAGEGCCFLYAPNDHRQPLLTGWMAQYSMLSSQIEDAEIQYPANAQKWAGATFDPTAWYRLKAVMDLWQKEGITVQESHKYVVSLQTQFLNELEGPLKKASDKLNLVGFKDFKEWGHFLAIEFKNINEAEKLEKSLLAKNILIDRRANRVRFGFGIYQDQTDVTTLTNTLSQLI